LSQLEQASFVANRKKCATNLNAVAVTIVGWLVIVVGCHVNLSIVDAGGGRHAV
jgi:hypothetical protein